MKKLMLISLICLFGLTVFLAGCKNEELEKEAEDAAMKAAMLSEKLEGVMADKQELTTKLQSTKEMLTDLNSKIETLKKVEQAKAELEKKFMDVMEQKEALTGELSTLKDKLSGYETQVKSLLDKNKELMKMIENLKGDAGEAMDKIELPSMGG